VEWWSGGAVEWWSGGAVEWWSGGAVDRDEINEPEKECREADGFFFRDGKTPWNPECN
jgi:hypothetical protein